MYYKKVVSLISVLAVFGFWNQAVMADRNVQVSGFLTAIATQGNNEKDATYGDGIATNKLEWDTRDNHLGLQFSSAIDPKIDVTAQLIARGGYQNYAVETDWAYIDYKPFQNAKMRFGKYKVPQFIASDYQDVGYAYPWVRPPQDVYGTNPLISLGGIDLSYKVNIYTSKLFLDVYYGDGTHKTTMPSRTVDLQGYPADVKGKPFNFETNKTRGFAVKYAAQTFTLRAGYFKTLVDADVEVIPGQPHFVLTDVPGAFGGVGFTMDVSNIIAYAEFIRRNTDPAMAGAFPDQDAWYTTLGYRFGKFLPTVTYSQIKPGVDKSDLAIEEKSAAVDLRYDIGQSAAVKFEALYVKPKEGNHGLFYEPVKNGRIYSASFDVIF